MKQVLKSLMLNFLFAITLLGQWSAPTGDRLINVGVNSATNAVLGSSTMIFDNVAATFEDSYLTYRNATTNTKVLTFSLAALTEGTKTVTWRPFGIDVGASPSPYTGTLVFGTGGTALAYSSGDDTKYNTFVGVDAGNAATTSNKNTLVGFSAGKYLTTGVANVYVGANAAGGYTAYPASSYNVVIGADACETYATTNTYNVSIGFNSEAGGTRQLSIGANSIAGAIPTGDSSNLAIGTSTQAGGGVAAARNIVIGNDSFAGREDVGSSNIVIGAGSSVPDYYGGSIIIGHQKTSSSNDHQLIIGDFIATRELLGDWDVEESLVVNELLTVEHSATETLELDATATVGTITYTGAGDTLVLQDLVSIGPQISTEDYLALYRYALSAFGISPTQDGVHTDLYILGGESTELGVDGGDLYLLGGAGVGQSGSVYVNAGYSSGEYGSVFIGSENTATVEVLNTEISTYALSLLDADDAAAARTALELAATDDPTFDELDVTTLDVGGGYGTSGATISSTGAISTDDEIITDVSLKIGDDQLYTLIVETDSGEQNAVITNYTDSPATDTSYNLILRAPTYGGAFASYIELDSPQIITTGTLYIGGVGMTLPTPGYIYQSGMLLAHAYNPPPAGGFDPVGQNAFFGPSAGNIGMGSSPTSVDHASYNVGVGYTALDSLTNGYANTAIGRSAGTALTTGYNNTLAGYNAGGGISTTVEQTLVGFQSGKALTLSRNTAIGAYTLFTASGAENNFAGGNGALYSLTTGDYNVAIGYEALQALTTTSSNVAVGYQAARYRGTGTDANADSVNGIFVGRDARPNAASSSNEIVIAYEGRGYGSNTSTIGNASTTDFYPRGNTRVEKSLYLPTATASTGVGAVFVGSDSFAHAYDPPLNVGSVNPDGRNTFVGQVAGNFTMGSTATNVIEGSRNVGMGTNALDSLTTGYNNVAVGEDALTALTTGYSNVAIGREAGEKYGVALGGDVTAANTSVFIGERARPLVDSHANQIVIGFDAVGGGNNTATIGNDDISVTYLKGTVTGNSGAEFFDGYVVAQSIVAQNDNSNVTLEEDGSTNWRLALDGNGDGGNFTISAGDNDGGYGGDLLLYAGTGDTPGTNDGKIYLGSHVILDNTVWDDIRVAGTNAIKIGASDPDFIKVRDNGSSSAGVYSYAFDADTEEQLFFTIQLPHSYKAGTDISPHIHWMPTTTGTNAVVWGLEYTWSNIDGTYGNTTLITATDAADGTAYKHQLADFADISGSGKNESSMLLCRIYRKAADAADTFTGDAVFLEVDFHFQMNKLGSDNEIPD